MHFASGGRLAIHHGIAHWRASPIRLRLIALLLIPLPICAAQSSPPPASRYVRAVRTLYTTSLRAGLVKAWCDARAPEMRTATDSALVAYKASYRLDLIDARADAVLGSERSALTASVLAEREGVYQRLDKESRSPAVDCRQLLTYLNRSANPRRLHPFEMLVAFSQDRAAPTAAQSVETAAHPSVASPDRPAVLPPGEASGPPSGTTAGTPPVAQQGQAGAPTTGGGTLFSVAQLSALIRRDTRTAQSRLQKLGRVTVQGTLEIYGDQRGKDESVWFNTVADGWRSTESIRCHDLSFRRLYDAHQRSVVLRGTVRSYDNWIVLENCEVLPNANGLVASTLPDSGGLQRIPVAASRIRTAPDQGLTMAQIDGMYQSTELRYDYASMLYLPDESTYLLLKDGWLYDGLAFTPHDLNVAASRALEPQHWHRWRRQGLTVQQQSYDQFGRTDGAWTTLKAIARPAIGTRRLSGRFSSTTSATAGIQGMGGAYSMATVSYTFLADGRFTWTNFTQMYASSSVGTGDGGASGVVGGAVFGPGGTSVSSVGGGDDEGTWTVDGYTLILRTKTGRVFRLSIFSWDSGKYRDHLVINGTTYSPAR